MNWRRDWRGRERDSKWGRIGYLPSNRRKGMPRRTESRLWTPAAGHPSPPRQRLRSRATAQEGRNSCSGGQPTPYYETCAHWLSSRHRRTATIANAYGLFLVKRLNLSAQGLVEYALVLGLFAVVTTARSSNRLTAVSGQPNGANSICRPIQQGSTLLLERRHPRR